MFRGEIHDFWLMETHASCQTCRNMRACVNFVQYAVERKSVSLTREFETS